MPAPVPELVLEVLVKLKSWGSGTQDQETPPNAKGAEPGRNILILKPPSESSVPHWGFMEDMVTSKQFKQTRKIANPLEQDPVLSNNRWESEMGPPEPADSRLLENGPFLLLAVVHNSDSGDTDGTCW